MYMVTLYVARDYCAVNIAEPGQHLIETCYSRAVLVTSPICYFMYLNSVAVKKYKANQKQDCSYSYKQSKLISGKANKILLLE